MLDQKRLKESLYYNHNTGIFRWKNISKFHNEKKGCEAGCLNAGYIIIKIDGTKYKAARLAWLYVHGELPDIVDHKNGIKNQNWIGNLRSCTIQQNTMNHGKKTNGSGLPCGVRKTPNGYQARVTCNKKVYHLGVYDSVSVAEAKYLEKRKELFGEYHRA